MNPTVSWFIACGLLVWASMAGGQLWVILCVMAVCSVINDLHREIRSKR